MCEWLKVQYAPPRCLQRHEVKYFRITRWEDRTLPDFIKKARFRYENGLFSVLFGYFYRFLLFLSKFELCSNQPDI